MEKKRRECKLQISFNTEPARSTRYSDEMFPLDDLVIVQDYSLDSMAFGERTVEKISPSMAEPFQLIEHAMCEESPKKKKKTEVPEETPKKKKEEPPKQENEKENVQNTTESPEEFEPDDKSNVLASITNWTYSFFPRLFD